MTIIGLYAILLVTFVLCLISKGSWKYVVFHNDVYHDFRYLNVAQNKLERLPTVADLPDEPPSLLRRARPPRPDVYTAPVLEEIYLQVICRGWNPFLFFDKLFLALEQQEKYSFQVVVIYYLWQVSTPLDTPGFFALKLYCTHFYWYLLKKCLEKNPDPMTPRMHKWQKGCFYAFRGSLTGVGKVILTPSCSPLSRGSWTFT